MDFVAIDVETANQRISSICQIGIAEYTAGRLVSEWKTLVNPQDAFDPLHTKIHGITAYIVADAPTLPDIYEHLTVRLHGKIVVCHTNFDREALTGALNLYGLPPMQFTWLDSAEVVRRTWKQFARKGYALKNVCDFLGYEFDHHDALEDAKAAGFIMVEARLRTGLNITDWLERVEKRVRRTKR